ncbi:MAG: 16S rRNA (cytosine(1402)-N(4))-methyltransferase RsmH [Cyclobacteriaceae bacterium]|nr:16S rRNA (cytosine(1402)-N(4))-methyltransferase RsmH [Cyclobacteriaceae bacterium HetDA_MAG_MS6]
MSYHVPVLLQESIEGLSIQPGGTYVDVTFGGGGHSKNIYNQLTKGKLIAFDQDPDAADNARNFDKDENRSFTFIASNFRHLRRFLKFNGFDQVDGILADLGVSSHQFDAAERGFSTRFDGYLDMRMNQESAVTAATVVNEYDEGQLIHIFSAYGEIKNARTLAAKIIQARISQPIETTTALREIALQVSPKGKGIKYLAQLYQAIRIEVNDEMGALTDFLEQCTDVLKPGGRLSVISYHSLEDRPVKNFINAGNVKGRQEKDFYGNIIRPFDPVNRKPIVPKDIEIDQNNRARSAKLRVATKR